MKKLADFFHMCIHDSVENIIDIMKMVIESRSVDVRNQADFIDCDILNIFFFKQFNKNFGSIPKLVYEN